MVNKFYLEIYKNNKSLFTGISLLKICNYFLLLICPKIYGEFINELLYHGSSKQIIAYLLLTILSLLIGLLIFWLQKNLYFKIIECINKSLVENYDMLSYESQKNADEMLYLQLISEDSHILANSFLEFMDVILIHLPLMLFGLLYYLSVSSKLLIFILISVLVHSLYLLYIMKKEEKWYKDSLRNQKSINDVAFSKIKSLWHSTLNDLTAFFNSYYLLQRKKYYKTEQEIELKTQLSDRVFTLLSVILTCSFYFLLAKNLNSSIFTVGDFYKYGSYYGYINSSMISILDYLIVRKKVIISMERIKNNCIMRSVVHNRKNINHSCNNQKVELRLVDCSYDISDYNLIEDFSYSFKIGEIYVINGKNGSGKTTLLNLIYGNITPNKGVIISHSWLLKKRILLKNEGIDDIYYDQIIIPILDKVYNDSDCFADTTLFKFYKDINGKQYSRMSTGEQMKVEILIVFSEKCKVYLLDEPTIGLDNNSITLLRNFLKRISQVSILIIVSHDPEIVDMADKIIDSATFREVI